MEKITKEMIISEVKKLDPKLDEGDEVFKVATILLSGLSVGANSVAISKFLNIPLADVKNYEKNLRKSNVWEEDKTCADWFDKEDGGISFWMDVNVALGYMERS